MREYAIPPHKKVDTDKIEFTWQQNSEGGFSRRVWASANYTTEFNIGHIDYIINNHRNDVRSIIALDYGTDVCRKKLTEDKVKFKP